MTAALVFLCVWWFGPYVQYRHRLSVAREQAQLGPFGFTVHNWRHAVQLADAAHRSPRAERDLWNVFEDEWGEPVGCVASWALLIILSDEEVEGELLPRFLERYTAEGVDGLAESEQDMVFAYLHDLVDLLADRDAHWADQLAQQALREWSWPSNLAAGLRLFALSENDLEPTLTFGVGGMGIHALALSGDGRRLAVGVRDNVIRIWDVASGSELRSIPWPWDVFSLALSPDGERLLVGGRDVLPIFGICDVSMEGGIQSAEAHVNRIHTVEFSANGRSFLTIGGGTVIVWDSASLAPLQEIRVSSADVSCARFTRDSQAIIAAAMDSTVGVWGVGEASPEHISSVPITPPARDLCLSQDGLCVMLGDLRGVTRWAPGRDSPYPLYPLMSFTPHMGARLAFTSDGLYVLTSDVGPNLLLWDVATGQIIRRLVGAGHLPEQIAVSTDGRFVAVGASAVVQREDQGDSIRVYDLSDIGESAEPRPADVLAEPASAAVVPR
ncbi:hypothetical protein JXA47_01275 [Candidatus Sumerlaeota bacterium]|nr:hypothetical protein [Candidatus Sumerlaeota bacterium]